MTKLFLVPLILVFAAAGSFCATVHLDSGESITGEIVNENDNYIALTSSDADIEINKEFIISIDRDIDEPFPSTGIAPGGGVHPLGSKEYLGVDLKVGIDFSGQHESNSDSESSTLGVDNGVTVAAEYSKYMEPRGSKAAGDVALGFGIAYEVPRKLEGLNGQISFLPVYGLMKIRMTPNRNKEFAYLMGQVGYNLFFANDAYLGSSDIFGGFYYGLGAGVDLRALNFTLLYSINRGSLSTLGSAVNINYSRVSLMAGMKIL